MTDHKIIFFGPVGSGKTTAINSLSDSSAVNTDAKATDSTSKRKDTTTVAMDYGQFRLSQDHWLRMYGTPGQMRFSFMWDLLANDLAANARSVVLLLDNTRNAPQRDLKFYCQEFAELIQRSNLAIGITQSDLRSEPTLETYQEWVAELELEAHIQFIDARKRSDMLNLIRQTLPEIPDELWDAHLTMCNDEEVAETPDSELEVTPYTGDNIMIKEAVIDDVLKVRGVKGAILATEMGDILSSSLDDPLIEEYIGFMAGMVPAFQTASSFDSARSILLKSATGDNLTIFIEEQQVLGVLSGQRTSTRILKQQVEDLLQWD